MKLPMRELDGILILDKPKGLTSNAALQTVKHLFRAKKAGHGGSLDPIATGLLPICFGEATKFSRFVLEANKHYQLTAALGIKTDTGDAEGKIIDERTVPELSISNIEAVLTQFRGDIEQIPSMYSALKHKGQPLYKFARQGIHIDRPPRTISIEALTLIAYQDKTLTLAVKASKGSYMRSLVDDIGEALGCGAHVTALRRLGAGPYVETQMVTLPMLQTLAAQHDSSGLDHCLLPIDSSISRLPALKLSEAAAFYLRQGQSVAVPYSPPSGWVRLIMNHNEQFLGVGEILDDGRVASRRLIKA